MIKHPAKYNDKFIPIFADILKDCEKVLDPYAGTGKLALIKDFGFNGNVICNEIEKEWVSESEYNVDEWYVGDAENMTWAIDEEFDAVCTSPTYGNRMADHFNAKDNSFRITYRHFLGRILNKENTGRMQWGKKYKNKHIAVYKEIYRVLKINGLLIINISDHIRKGKVVKVSEWHKNKILELPFELINHIKVETERMGFGSNRKKRVKFENIYVFEKVE